MVGDPLLTKVDKQHFYMFLREAVEAFEVAKRIVKERDLESFIRSMEARYALRYALVLMVEALADAITLVLEADHGIAPESYREAMLFAGELGIVSYEDALVLARLASLRNILVHRYWRVEDDRLYRETRKGLEVVDRVLEALKKYVETSDP
ncbi:MAG TPA: DUF86 domain-containing protein [Pyrodictium sp.]|nr:DUF86 domain-containing protein [Pyrodictium sp.]